MKTQQNELHTAFKKLIFVNLKKSSNTAVVTVK